MLKDMAYDIQLMNCGAIKGRLMDSGGVPRSRIKICLDRDTFANTDDKGYFFFPFVAGGTHGIHIPDVVRDPDGRSLIAVPGGGPWGINVAPGTTTKVELEPGLAKVILTILDKGEPIPSGLKVCLIGLDSVFTYAFGTVHEGRFNAQYLIPGRYLLISNKGHMVNFSAISNTVTVDLGTGRVTVKGKPGTRFYLAPEGSSSFIRLISKRIMSCRLPATGKLTVGPLPLGRYEIYRNNDKEGIIIHVKGQGCETILSTEK